MTSSLLEQSIIDAQALKEAAIKNAQNIVLEKYASQLKEAVNSILNEQNEEEDLLDLGEPTSGNAAPTEDPLANNLPMAATDGEKTCPCPEEDEEIEIDFDQLSQQMDQTNKDLGATSEEPLIREQDELELTNNDNIQVPSYLGPELHMYHTSMGDPVYRVGSLAYAGKEVPLNLLESAISNLERLVEKMDEPEDKTTLENLINQLQELTALSSGKEPTETIPEPEITPTGSAPITEIEDSDYGLDEDVISKILETLEVDIQNVPHGHIGHATTSERLEADEIDLARQQDTRIAGENKELKKAIKKLEEHNKSLKLENNEVKSLAFKASKKLEEINIQNAKLLYMNRVLKNNSLNERQRNNIVEAISKVDSVNEAKMVFETLEKSLETTTDSLTPKTLNEVISRSKNTILLKQQNKSTNNSDPLRERMLKLAGIKK